MVEEEIIEEVIEEITEEVPEVKQQIVHLTFDCYEFFKFIEALEKYVDEMELVFENREFSITFMDASRIMMCKCTKDISIYNTGVLERMAFGVNVKDLMSLLKTRKTDKKEVEIIFDNTKDYIELIKTSEKYNSTIERTLITLDLELEEIPMNNLALIDYTAKGSFPISFLNDFFYESGLYSDIVDIHINEDEGISFEESGSIGKTNYLIKPRFCNELRGNEKGSYSYTYLTPIKPLLYILDSNSEMVLNIKTDHPIKIELCVEPLDIDMVIFTAPRVEEAEWDDDDDDMDDF